MIRILFNIECHTISSVYVLNTTFIPLYIVRVRTIAKYRPCADIRHQCTDYVNQCTYYIYVYCVQALWLIKKVILFTQNLFLLLTC